MEREYFCELAALYALDILDPSESFIVDDAIAQFPELELEFTEFRNAVGIIAYEAADVAIAPDLKQRLFERIATEATISKQTASIPELKQQAQTVTWEPYPLPGVMVGTLDINNDTREVRCFVRADGAVKFPNHKHAGQEEIVVLEGDLVIGEQQYKSGDRIFSLPDTIHQPETQHGCLLFLHTSLDDKILDNLTSG